VFVEYAHSEKRIHYIKLRDLWKTHIGLKTFDPFFSIAVD